MADEKMVKVRITETVTYEGWLPEEVACDLDAADLVADYLGEDVPFTGVADRDVEVID